MSLQVTRALQVQHQGGHHKSEVIKTPAEFHLNHRRGLQERLASDLQSRRSCQEPGKPSGDSGRPRNSGKPHFSDVASGRTMNRTGWMDLMSRVQPGDTIVVAFLDRFSRNFEEGVRIQAELTGRDIGIVAIRENIDTSDGSAAAKYFRRSMLAQGAYQVDSASERIKLGLARARGNGKKVGRPPTLTPEQVEQCRRMANEGSRLRHIAWVMACSPVTVKKALAAPHLET